MSYRAALIRIARAHITSGYRSYVCLALDAACTELCYRVPPQEYSAVLIEYRKLTSDVRDWVVFSNGGDLEPERYYEFGVAGKGARLALLNKLERGESPPNFEVVQPDTMCISWSVSDVQLRVPRLTHEQAASVLTTAIKNHDCNEGICWSTFDVIAECLYPAPGAV